MSEGIIEVKLRNTAGTVQTLRVTEIVEIDGKPYNAFQTDDLQVCFQAIRNLEGRIDEQANQIATLINALVAPQERDET